MKIKLFQKLAILSCVLVSINSHAGTHGRVWSSAITKWDGDCSGSRRDWWDDMCMAWRKKMGSKGWSQHYANFHTVKAHKYVDSKVAGWGDDRQYLDSAHAGLICTHGGHNSTSGWYGVMHTKQHGKCSISAQDMRLGPKNNDGALSFFHLSSCNSARWDERLKWVTASGDKIHVITGFHGWMYIGSRYVKEYRKLAEKAQSSKGVGKTWVDQMHHTSHWYNAWATVCPISLGFGDTSSRATNAQNEKYRSKWSHKDRRYMSTRYVSKCNPDDGPKLP